MQSYCNKGHRVRERRKDGKEENKIRTERESERRREVKWQACGCSQDHRKACRMALVSKQKSWNKLGQPHGKGW